MVNLYCSLLFSRKETIKFSEVALLPVHCNCLIDWIVIMHRYQSWNTIHTTMNLCLLVKNGNKKTKCKVCSNFYISHFAALRPTLGHWQGSSLTQLISITTLFQVQPQLHQEPLNNIASHSMTKRIRGFKLETFQFLM